MFETLQLSQWIMLSVCALCIGMSKTGIQGLMLAIVPYMAMLFGAKESTGIILPMLCMADVIAVIYYRRIADWRIIVKLLPTAVIGFFIAIAVDRMIPADEFKHLMGWTLLSALVVIVWNVIFKKHRPWMDGWWYSSFFGLLGGFTTMIGNAAGPVMSVYLLSLKKDKMAFVGINAWFFLVINLLKVPLQIFVWHNISLESFSLNLLILPVIFLGAFVGFRIVRILPEKVFKCFIFVVVLVSVIMMLM